jgi:hypothetical protein
MPAWPDLAAHASSEHNILLPLTAPLHRNRRFHGAQQQPARAAAMRRLAWHTTDTA